MKKNKLEDLIMDRVYSVETKRTGFSLISKFITFVFIGGAVFILIQVIQEFLLQGDIVRSLSVISEDREVFTSHIGEMIRVIFDEVPIPITVLTVVGTIICVSIMLAIVLNFEKIKNRIKAIVLHWRK